ncbi:hypothetical protein BT69DRAFT_1278015 [Atractiella rhizophila]|nr:hypothetical protein BT69DRAFT_1278015 [Atractiella rhizophila]
MSFLLLFTLVLSTVAFHWKPGSTCTANTPCTYSYQVESGVEKTKVEANCAPNGYCADNGAKCSNDSQCFGWCGPDGFCGGEGALCNSRNEFQHTPIHWEYTCAPGLECSTTDMVIGVCQNPRALKVTMQEEEVDNGRLFDDFGSESLDKDREPEKRDGRGTLKKKSLKKRL